MRTVRRAPVRVLHSRVMSTPHFLSVHQLYTDYATRAMADEAEAEAGRIPYWAARDAWMCAVLSAPDRALHDYALDRACDCAVANGDPVETMHARFPDRY